MSSEAQPPTAPNGARAPEPEGRDVPVATPHGGSFLTNVLWGLVGMLLGVVMGAAGVGETLTARLSGDAGRARDARELSVRLGDLRRDLVAREQELAAEREARKETAGALKQATEAAEWAKLATVLKQDFLNRLLAHEQGRSEASRAALVDTVCGLWKQRQAARMSIATGPLDVREEEIRAGLRPEIEAFLLQSGLAPELPAKARRQASQIPMPAVTPYNVFEVQRAAQARHQAMRDSFAAVSAIKQHLLGTRVARSVGFADGVEYAIAPDVALAMVRHRDCKIP